MRWSILTPECCAHWDGEAVHITDGVDKRHAPQSDEMEDFWRSYYSAIFNPARLKVGMMLSEMPKKYWRNLPEAQVIPFLIAGAARQSGTMIAAEPTAPNQRPHQWRREKPMLDHTPTNYEALRAQAAQCRDCPLWKPATQAVFGEGPVDARVMFVGEQPGDHEDLTGHPFVGPAGKIFDKALEAATIDRSRIYVTNAVKHFKFTPRGRLRLHQSPDVAEIHACHQWLEQEIALVRPQVIVAMGATAARSVLGKAMPIGKNRGRVMDTNGGRVLVTVHPSYLLRVPEMDREREYRQFVEDIGLIRDYL